MCCPFCRDTSPKCPQGKVVTQTYIVPQNGHTLNTEQAVLMEKLIDTMEDDDVQNVWHNWEE